MILVENDIDISKYWEHDPLLTDKNGNTIAMLLAYKGKDIP